MCKAPTGDFPDGQKLAGEEQPVVDEEKERHAVGRPSPVRRRLQRDAEDETRREERGVSSTTCSGTLGRDRRILVQDDRIGERLVGTRRVYSMP